jgi:hypothetical protein
MRTKAEAKIGVQSNWRSHLNTLELPPKNVVVQAIVIPELELGNG